MRTDALVVSLLRCPPTSIVASARIARFLADAFDLPLVDSKPTALEALKGRKSFKFLIMINGPFPFCSFDEQAHDLVRRTRHVIWVQNDYSLELFRRKTTAQVSMLRRATLDWNGRIDYWTTCAKTIGIDDAGHHSLVNWNQLTYDAKLADARGWKLPSGKRALYYGAFRRGRLESFDRFLGRAPGSFVVSAPKAAMKRFSERYPEELRVVGPAEHPLTDFRDVYPAGLYVEDERSHREYHCPANRLYEMLSMRLSVLVDDRAATTLQQAGFSLEHSMLVADGEQVEGLLRRRATLERVYAQQAPWRATDWRRKLRAEVAAAAKRSEVA